MATRFQQALASKAQQQYAAYHLLRENQSPLSGQIASYWQDLGFAFTSVSVPWSAVFVSWCVFKAGATPAQFRFSARHSEFVHWAIANARAATGDFHGHAIGAYAPKVGDILQNNRSGNHFDFAYAAAHRQYDSHSAVVIEAGADNQGRYLRTIGGNESDSVGLKEVRLDASGKVINRNALYISIIETRL